MSRLAQVDEAVVNAGPEWERKRRSAPETGECVLVGVLFSYVHSRMDCLLFSESTDSAVDDCDGGVE